MTSVALAQIVAIVARQVDPRLPQYASLPLINGENIEPGTTRLLFRRSAASEHAISSKYEVDVGDVVYSKLRPYLRKVVVADEPGLCSADLYPLRPDLRRVDPQWLAWLLVSERFTSYAAQASARARMPKLNRDELLAYRFELPEVSEQQQMSAELCRQFAAVEVAREAALRRSLESGRSRVQAIEQAIGTATKWPSRRLGDVAEIQLGKMLSPASRMGRRPMPYLRNANVQWDRFDLSEINEMDFDAREETKFRLRPGDVLVCEGGEPGRAAVWAGQIEPCLYQKALHRLRPIDDAVDPQYLVYRLWLSALRGEFTGSHAQTTIAHLPAIRLAELEIGTPPVAIQRRIVNELRERLAAIDAMTDAINTELEAIEALPAALLRRAFDGLAA